MGRWVNRDPIGERGFVASADVDMYLGNEYDQDSAWWMSLPTDQESVISQDMLNLYGFVRNIPIQLIDVLGMYSATEGGCKKYAGGCNKEDRGDPRQNRQRKCLKTVPINCRPAVEGTWGAWGSVRCTYKCKKLWEWFWDSNFDNYGHFWGAYKLQKEDDPQPVPNDNILGCCTCPVKGPMPWSF